MTTDARAASALHNAVAKLSFKCRAMRLQKHPVERKNRPRSLHGAVAFGITLVSAVACHDPNTDDPWSLHEQRTVYATPSLALAANAPTARHYAFLAPKGLERTVLALAAAESLTIGRDVLIKEDAQGHTPSDWGVVSSAGSLKLSKPSASDVSRGLAAGNRPCSPA
jgi:hypothetical protein